MISRKSLDVVLAGGGVALAILLLVVGFILADQGSFARSYVKDQLGQQKITFPAAEALTEEDLNWQPGSTCLSDYAGQLMETGKQAECYANYYIKMHMVHSAENAGFPGATYATLGGIRSGLTADIAAAKEKGDTAAAESLQKQFDAATSLRSSALTGETLRGILLTSYGFSVFGEKAALASDIAYIAAAVMIVLAVAGFAHAVVTPREKTVFNGVRAGAGMQKSEPASGG